MADNSIYANPLITRYASREMAEAFSDDKRFKLWRKLWIALAESEMELEYHAGAGRRIEKIRRNDKLRASGKV